MADSWKLTLPCTREEGERIAADLELLTDLNPPPVLMTSEPDESRPDDWRLDAYFESEPAPDAIAAVCALVPSAKGHTPKIEHVEAADWVTLSQAGLEPVHAGRFYVHTSANKGRVPEAAIPFRIEAGLAFGTGTHETTSGCLAMLDAIRRAGAVHRDIADIGTGTGLLAFAALKLWPRARVIASDIDPVSIEVVRENAGVNGIRLGDGPGALALAVAPGLDDQALVARAPYDLIIANIVAWPLIELAPVIAAALAPGGELILAGLLDSQADAITTAYRRHRLRPAGRIDRGHWPTLRLRKRPF